MNDYSEKLKSPHWQRYRLKIMAARNWKCEICGDTEEELHVHHKKYRDCEPWSYADGEMECLCATCHSLRHKAQHKIYTYAAKSLGLTEQLKTSGEIKNMEKYKELLVEQIFELLKKKSEARVNSNAEVTDAAEPRSG